MRSSLWLWMTEDRRKPRDQSPVPKSQLRLDVNRGMLTPRLGQSVGCYASTGNIMTVHTLLAQKKISAASNRCESHKVTKLPTKRSFPAGCGYTNAQRYSTFNHEQHLPIVPCGLHGRSAPSWGCRSNAATPYRVVLQGSPGLAPGTFSEF
jgi:hypothetical protein